MGLLGARFGGGVLATCVSNRVSRSSTTKVHAGVSTTIRAGGPGLLYLSFSGMSFVSSSNVNLMVKQCHRVGLINKTLHIVGVPSELCELFSVSKLRDLKILE